MPAHLLHSLENFSLYDTKSKVVFSDDIGTAIITFSDKIIESFDEHKESPISFEKRYMESNKFCRAWIREIEKYDVVKIVPQHGFAFENENVGLFLAWLKELECGSDLIEDLY